jgi:hypothetical protein
MVPHGDQENPVSVGIQTRRFQIELHSTQVIKRESPEVGSAGRDEVLFLRRQREDGLFSEVAQVRDAPVEPPCRSLQDRRDQRLPSPAEIRYRSEPGPSSSRHVIVARSQPSRPSLWPTR